MTMSILRKKILRDISRSKFRAIVIVLTIFVSTALVVGLNNAAIDIDESFKKSFEELNAYDLSVITGLTSMDVAQELKAAITNVKDIETRIFLKTELIELEPARDFNGHWISIPGGRRPLVNDIKLSGQGSYFSEPYAAECLVNIQFAKARAISIGQSLTLKYGPLKTQFSVIGIVMSPEYFYVVDEETGILAPTNLGVVFTPLELTQSLLNLTGMVNQFSITIKDEGHIDDTITSIQAFLAQKGVAVGNIIKRSLSAETNTYEVDVGGMDAMAYAFSSIIMIVAIVSIYNSVTKLISAQCNYIGVMAALGGRRRKIILHYFSFTLVLSSVGIIVGVVVGVGFSWITTTWGADMLQIPFVQRSLHLEPFVKGVTYVLSVALAVGLWGAYQATKITPREAMTSSFITEVFARKPLMERFSDILPGRRRRTLLVRIPLRNLFRRKKRSAVTIFTIAISMILIISSLSMVDSFFGAIDVNFEKNEKYDLQVLLDQPYPQNSVLNNVTQIPGINHAEAYIQSPCMVMTNSSSEPHFALLKAYAKSSLLRSYHVVKGTDTLAPASVLVGEMLADELSLVVGDWLSLGLTTMKQVKIVGITGELVDVTFMTTIEEAQEILGFGNAINGFVLDIEPGQKQAVREALRDNLPVQNVFDPDEVKKGIQDLLDLVLVFVWMLTGFGIFIEMLFVFNTILLNVSEREMEFITLKALGTSRTQIYKLILYETLFLSSVGLLVGLPLGYFANAYTIREMAGGFMYVIPVVPFSVMLFVIGVGLLTAVAAGLYSARRVDHLNLVDFMRERVIG